MVGQVDRGGRIGGGQVVDFERIVFCQSVPNRDVQIAGIPFLAIFAKIMKFQARGILFYKRLSLPNDFVESYRTAVDVAWHIGGKVVGDQVIGFAVEIKPSIGDAVSHPTDDRSEVRGIPQIFGQGVVTQDDIVHVAVPVRNHEPNHDSSVIGYVRLYSVGISQGVEGGFRAVFCLAKGFHCDGRGGSTRG